MIKTILVTSDTVSMTSLAKILKRYNYDIIDTTSTIYEAIASIRQHEPEIVLIDVSSNENAVDSLLLASKIQNMCPIPIVFFSAYNIEESLENLQLDNLWIFIRKPTHSVDILKQINELVIKSRTTKHV